MSVYEITSYMNMNKRYLHTNKFLMFAYVELAKVVTVDLKVVELAKVVTLATTCNLDVLHAQ